MLVQGTVCSLFCAVRLRQGRRRHVRPAVQPAEEGDPARRLLDRVHHGGRRRAALEPRHRLLRGLLARALQQVTRALRPPPVDIGQTSKKDNKSLLRTTMYYSCERLPVGLCTVLQADRAPRGHRFCSHQRGKVRLSKQAAGQLQ